MEAWNRIAISAIEELSDAVYGAGLEATQISRGRLSASLAVRERNGVTFSSGLIGGRVGLTGPLSPDAVTLGIGLRLPQGTKHWLNDVTSGNIGVFLPGDQHDSIYVPGSLYAVATLSMDRLEEIASQNEMVLDRDRLGGSGIHSKSVPASLNAWLSGVFERVHANCALPGDADAENIMLASLIRLLARPPYPRNLGFNPSSYGRIVARAREYIHAHLADPLSIDTIAAVAFSSRRTLYRAFAEVLDETPQQYVRRLRLHRIRSQLATPAERACSIALLANEWGIGDVGRMSGSYRKLFGEVPSETLARAISALH